MLDILFNPVTIIVGAIALGIYEAHKQHKKKN